VSFRRSRTRRPTLRLLQHLRRLRRPRKIPVTESGEESPVSPYGRSKYFVEQISPTLRRKPELQIRLAQIFNASGCAMDGTIGEDHDPETHSSPSPSIILGLREGVTLLSAPITPQDGTHRDYISMSMTSPTLISRAMQRTQAGKSTSPTSHRRRFFGHGDHRACEKVPGKKCR